MQTCAAEYSCAWCGEINHTFVDPSQGEHQNYIEDCQVCCHPNELHISKVENGYDVRAESE
ncbi:MAG: CPXCG motif-containing cysteine-rich protein [Balneolales bacterium]